MKRIMCYGDSNTWGYTPGSGVRFDENTRWTALVQKHFGSAVQIMECGLNGRTTSFPDPFYDYRHGRHGLAYSLMECKPIDCAIISLGTNDLKFGTAAHSAKGLDLLLSDITNANTVFPGSSPVFPGESKILVISPIHLHSALDETFPDSEFFGKVEESHRFAQMFSDVAKKHRADFLDAALYAQASEADCIHMDASSHRQLANAIASKLQQMLKL
ncbi:MAG: hypothetical protein J6J43_08980 [Oscillospiraceae bacterium]|nr:hypothetical protein [Oscillospiraceae bacterium]